MCKKIMSVLIVFSLLIPATFASGVPNGPMSIEDEIQRRVDERMEVVARQLKRNGDLDLYEVFEEIVYARTQVEVSKEFGDGASIVPFGDEDEVRDPPLVTLPYGGVVNYYIGEMEVTEILMDPERTLNYLLDSNEIQLSTIVKDMIGMIPYIGNLYSAVSGAGDSDLWSMIKDADYYTNIYQYFDVDDRIYKEIVMPWVDHPECQIPDSASHWMIYYAKEYKG